MPRPPGPLPSAEPPERDRNRREGDADEAPPILKSWRNLYLLVIAALVAEILFLYGLSSIGR